MKNEMNENTLSTFPKKTARTPCECWSRSMGYVRPVSNFNIGKYQEFCDRNTFKEANCLTAGLRHEELMKDCLLKKAA